MTVKVAVTGASGRVAYDLLFRLAAGDVFGPRTPVELRLLELPAALQELEGRAMELHDCAFPTLAHIEIGSDARHIFADVDYALLVAGMPRKQGMDRSDLLKANGALFGEQGRVLDEVAARTVKVLVTGNPANTNCAIASANAPGLPARQFSALTRLDQNRARHRLGKKLGVPVGRVTKLAVWGNHSNTMFPDVYHAEVDAMPAWPAIDDQAWLEDEFLPVVAGRGAKIIAQRGASSAASAASATVDALRDWATGSPAGDWVSMAVASDGSYGVPEGLFSSFPVTVSRDGEWRIIEGIEHGDFARAKIAASVAELESERAAIQALGLV